MKRKRRGVLRSKKKPQGASADTQSAPGKRKWREVASSEPISNGFHNYKADPLDHAETDARAYAHVAPLLELIAQHLSKKPADLQLWDPYFCKGAVVKNLARLGFKKVHNVNEDFYALSSPPEHDVLLTSPPYSADHVERCLRFCATSRKSWLLLLPNWVENKPYFREILGKEGVGRIFFMSPVERYTYWMPPDLVKGSSRPGWVGTDGRTAPFESTWFVQLQRSLPLKKIYAALEKHEMAKRAWVTGSTLKAARWKVKKLRKTRQMQIRGGDDASLDPGDAEEPDVTEQWGKRKKHKKWGNTIVFD